MARQAIHPRRSALSVLAALLGAATLLLLVGVSQAFALAEPPVWRTISSVDPTHLIPGSPQNEVQTITVNATKGTFTITNCAEAPIAYNASASAVETALASCFGGVHVAGGPLDSKPAEVEFTGYWAGESVGSLQGVNSEKLEGGSATLSTVHTAVRGSQLQVSATDVGGTTNGSSVTIEDTLPQGLTAETDEGRERIRVEDTFLGGGFGESDGWTCSPKPETERVIRCTFEKYIGSNGQETPIEIVTGDTLIVTIPVKATTSPAHEEVNLVSVSGGGATPTSSSTPVEISDEPASFGPAPGSVIAALSNDQAGGHASLTTAFTLNTAPFGTLAERQKDIRFELPPGLVGDARQLPTCTMAEVENQFEEAYGCPPATMVGIATFYYKVGPGNAAYPLDTPVYSIKPAPGEPVAFGFDALYFPVRLDTSVISEGNYGVRVTAPSLTEAAETFSTWVTIWGVPAEHNGPPANPNVVRNVIYGRSFGGPEPSEPKIPLLTNPQQCGEPLQTIFSADSWIKAGQFKYESTTMPPLEGCEALSMQPSFTMLPDTLEAGAPAGYTMNMVIPQKSAAESLATPTVKTLKVALPVGVVVSPSVAWGLKVCSEAAFGLHSGELAECPREAQVGEVEIHTPDLSETLKGQVFLAEPQCGAFCTPEDAQDGKMIKLYVQAVSQGEAKIIVKLDGEGSINQQTGQITTTFENDPPLPFNELTLKLGGGSRAALANPRECRPVTTNLDITPWSSPFTEDSSPFYTFNLNQNCFGPTFDPTVTPGTDEHPVRGIQPVHARVRPQRR